MKTLYVGNLPWSTTEARLAEVFGAHGTVRGCRVISDRDSGRSRGFGFVEVDDTDVASIVNALNNTQLDGRTIVVNEARPRQPRY